MPLIRQPQYPARPPRANPINRGLFYLTQPGIDGGKLMGGTPTAVGCTRVTGPSGGPIKAGDFNGTSSLILATPPLSDGPMTWCALAVMDTSGSLKYLAGTNFNGTDEPVVWRCTGGTLELLLLAPGGSLVAPAVSFSTAGVAAGEVVFVYARIGAAGTSATHETGIIRRGTRYSATSGAFSGSSRNTRPWYVGGWANGSTPGRWYTQPIAIFGAWARTLSDAELMSLATNPWQVFSAPAKRTWIEVLAAAVARRAVGYIVRFFRRQAAPVWTPAQLFLNSSDRGFWLDFTDATKRRDASNAQAANGVDVRTMIPSAGTASNFTAPVAGTAVARAGYTEMGGVDAFSGICDFQAATRGGWTTIIVFTEPATIDASGYASTIDAQYNAQRELAGAEFRGTTGTNAAADFALTYDASNTFTSLAHNYTRTPGQRTVVIVTVDATTMTIYRDSTTPAATGPSGGKLRDQSAVPFAIGASWGGAATLTQGFYIGKAAHAVTVDRVIASGEIAQAMAFGLAVSL